MYQLFGWDSIVNIQEVYPQSQIVYATRCLRDFKNLIETKPRDDSSIVALGLSQHCFLHEFQIPQMYFIGKVDLWFMVVQQYYELLV